VRQTKNAMMVVVNKAQHQLPLFIIDFQVAHGHAGALARAGMPMGMPAAAAPYPGFPGAGFAPSLAARMQSAYATAYANALAQYRPAPAPAPVPSFASAGAGPAGFATARRLAVPRARAGARGKRAKRR